jgi:hypothetical protein
MAWGPAHFVNCLFLVLLALFLALPLPSPPFFFSNSIPSYAIVILSASMMEEDGALVWVAYAFLLGNIVFFALIGELIVQIFLRAFHAVTQYFSGL